jgi:molybdopterin-containing oxidoreductase family membrane subunit
MKLSYTTIDFRPRGFYLLNGILAALAIMGFICFVISYMEGHHVFGISNAIPWGMAIVITIYLIGLSAGSLMLSSLTYVFGREEYRAISRISVFLADVLIFGAMVGISLDLGRPEKMWRLFTFFVLNNMRSMFAVNGIFYGVYFAISFIYLGLIFAEKMKLIKKMGILAMIWAAMVHMGTGAIFGFVAARPIFFSPLKPLEFLAAAMASGLALLIIVVIFAFKFAKRNFKKEPLFSLGKLLLGLIIALAVLVIIDKLTHLYSPHREPMLWLLAGPFAWIFWIAQVGCAYILPIFFLVHPRFRKTIKGLMAASFFVVMGIFFERFLLVIPGTAHPMPFYPGQIEGIWGEAGSFPLTLIELLMCLGIFALMGLFFIHGCRNLELLPMVERKESTPESGERN